MNDLKPILTIGAVIVVLLLFIPGLRQVIFAVTGNVVWPAATWLMKAIGVWGIWFIKRLYSAHLNIFVNLTRPNSVIFPTLDKKNEPDTDKAS